MPLILNVWTICCAAASLTAMERFRCSSASSLSAMTQKVSPDFQKPSQNERATVSRSIVL
jgi:ABC-type molybdate transport system substrate-binding protein